MSEGLTENVNMEDSCVTIRVNAMDDSNGQLLYAIDSDAPDAFTPFNEFTVEKGSDHTVYVKDASGNISAQVYRVPDAAMDLEVDIGYSPTSSSAMITEEAREAVESGGGTVAESIVTDDSKTAERLFYTVTTKNEHVFYLMVDQSRDSDNVYLLDQVTDEDLYALTGAEGEKKEAESIFQATEENTNTLLTENRQTEAPAEKQSAGGGWFIYFLLILLAAGAFYYYKIYKPKQQKLADMTDAMDLDEFEADEEDNEVLDFSVSKEERDAMLNSIMNSSDISEEDLSYDPEEMDDDEFYAISHKEEDDGEGSIAELDLDETGEDE